MQSLAAWQSRCPYSGRLANRTHSSHDNGDGRGVFPAVPALCNALDLANVADIDTELGLCLGSFRRTTRRAVVLNGLAHGNSVIAEGDVIVAAARRQQQLHDSHRLTIRHRGSEGCVQPPQFAGT